MKLSRRRCFVNFFAAVRCLLIFLCGVAVFRDPQMSFSSLVRSIKGREGRGKRKRAAKGDGKGETSGCQTT